jgi:hypothetical protein
MTPRASRLRPLTDVSAANWVVEGVAGFGSGITGFLPSCFEAYARILHPAWPRGDRAGDTDSPKPVTWEAVAGETGRQMHSRVEFDALIGAERGESRDYEPDVGEMPPALLSALCEVLAGHTATPERCWFCLWEGWGWIDGAPSAAVILISEGDDDPGIDMPPAFPPEIMDGPRVSLPGRDYILFEGPLAAATEMGWRIGELVQTEYPDVDVEQDYFSPQTPSLFWPEDRAWCVATEIDLDSTYVGGSEAMVRALLADSRFEVWRAELDDRVDSGGDDVNV